MAKTNFISNSFWPSLGLRFGSSLNRIDLTRKPPLLLCLLWIQVIFWIDQLICDAANAKPAGTPVCSLDIAQNAIYWRIPEDTEPDTVVDILPIAGKVDEEIALRLVAGMNSFALNDTNKQLILTTPVDREAGTTRLDAVVECRSLLPNDDFKVNISVLVKIQDVNDNRPQFTKKNYFVNITEELPVGTVIFNGLKATDQDQKGPNSEIHFSIVDGPYSDLVSIPRSWDGGVIVAKRIDYEQLPNFTLTISAKDAGDPPLESRSQLTIQVQDADDLNPKFEYQSYTAAVRSPLILNQTIKTKPGKILAMDQDTLNSPIRYGLTGEKSNLFWINPKTGLVKQTGILMAKKTYHLTIKAQQMDRPERESSAMLTIVVGGRAGSDSNSGSAANSSTKSSRKLGPRFIRPVYRVSTPETSHPRTQLIQVSAIDVDKPNARILYAIDHPERVPEFSINQNTGVLINTVTLDYEKKPKYSFKILASNGIQTTQSKVEVRVMDRNDGTPEFTQPVYTFLPDGKTSRVGVVRARDPDGRDQIFYHLLNFNNLFSIDMTGSIRMRKSAVREHKLTNMTYELVVMAVDTGKPPRQSHAKVRIDFSNTSGVSLMKLESTSDGKDDSSESIMAGSNAVVVIVALASVSALLLAICFFLIIYVCQRKHDKVSSSSSAAGGVSNGGGSNGSGWGGLEDRRAGILTPPLVGSNNIGKPVLQSNNNNNNGDNGTTILGNPHLGGVMRGGPPPLPPIPPMTGVINNGGGPPIPSMRRQAPPAPSTIAFTNTPPPPMSRMGPDLEDLEGGQGSSNNGSSPQNVSFASDDSPHGSQSPLADSYPQNHHPPHHQHHQQLQQQDRGMSFTYSPPQFPSLNTDTMPQPPKSGGLNNNIYSEHHHHQHHRHQHHQQQHSPTTTIPPPPPPPPIQQPLTVYF